MTLSMAKDLDLSRLKTTESIPIYPSHQLSSFFLEGLPFDYYCLYLNLPVYYEDFDHDFAHNVYHFKIQESELFTNYPVNWQELYFEQELQFKDPVLSHANKVFSPFFWGDSMSDDLHSGLRTPKLESQDLTDLIRQSSSYGINCGLSIPLTYGSENIGIITLASKSIAQQLNYFELTALCSYTKAVGEYFAFYKKGSVENKLDLIKASYNITKYQQLVTTKDVLQQYGLMSKD